MVLTERGNPEDLEIMFKDDSLSGIRIDWICRNDLEQIMEIERLAFPEFPWSEQEMVEMLQCTGVSGRKVTASPIAVDGENPAAKPRILGYYICRYFSWKIELLSIAVHPDFRRIGVGKLLVSYSMAAVRPDTKRSRVLAEVRESNLEAQCFLRALGWTSYDVKKKYFANGEDAYSFRYMPPHDSLS